jgi:hypothetical protein
MTTPRSVIDNYRSVIDNSMSVIDNSILTLQVVASFTFVIFLKYWPQI